MSDINDEGVCGVISGRGVGMTEATESLPEWGPKTETLTIEVVTPRVTVLPSRWTVECGAWSTYVAAVGTSNFRVGGMLDFPAADFQSMSEAIQCARSRVVHVARSFAIRDAIAEADHA